MSAEPFPHHNLQLKGNIGSDPEVRFSKYHSEGYDAPQAQRGTRIIEVSLAVYDGKDQNGDPKTVWWKVQGYKEIGDQILAQVEKGDRLRVKQGKAEFQAWVDKQTGQIRTKNVCKAWEIEVIKREPKPEQQQQQTQLEGANYDEIPF